MPGKIGRPSVGVKVDFRIPEEVKEWVEADAERLGIPHDEHYRNIFVFGVQALRSVVAGARSEALAGARP